MYRNRQRRQREGFVPVAAEVLETRNLLSNAAAAAHTVAQHAALQYSAETGAAVAPLAVQAGGTVFITVGNTGKQGLRGNVSVSSVNPAIGSHVTIHVSFSFQKGGVQESFKSSFTGKVQSTTPAFGATQFTIIPTGGKMVFTRSSPGAPTEKATAVPKGTPMLMVTTGTALLTFTATDVFKPGSADGLGGQPFTVEFQAG